MGDDDNASQMPTSPSFHAQQQMTMVDVGDNQQPTRPPPDDNGEASTGQMACRQQQQQHLGKDDDTSQGWPMMPSPSPPIHPDDRQ